MIGEAENGTAYSERFPWLVRGSLVEVQVAADWYVGKVLEVNIGIPPHSVKIAYRKNTKTMSLVVLQPSWQARVHAFERLACPEWLRVRAPIQYHSRVRGWRDGLVVELREFDPDAASSQVGCTVEYREVSMQSLFESSLQSFKLCIVGMSLSQSRTELRLLVPRTDSFFLTLREKFSWIPPDHPQVSLAQTSAHIQTSGPVIDANLASPPPMYCAYCKSCKLALDVLVDDGFYHSHLQEVDLGIGPSGTAVKLQYHKARNLMCYV